MRPGDWPSRRLRTGGGTAAALVALGIAALALAVAAPGGRRANAAIGRCGVASGEVPDLAWPLPHVAAALASGRTLTIVALGSSSTFGTGATRPENSYPSRLAAALAARWRQMRIRVLNRGVPGEEAASMAVRIDRDVIAEKPDLAIWQVGTNGVLREEDATAMGEVVRSGIERMKEAGIDVMVMNPQYAPAVLQHPHYRETLHVLDAVARLEEVPLFPRFALMRHWAEEGRMTLPVMIRADRLHMTDVSYDCLGRQVAASIDRLAERPALASN